MTRLVIAALLALATYLLSSPGFSAEARVVIDDAGVMRWRDTGAELALFGVNYCLPSASDYRAAGYVGADRAALIEQDFAHFRRMGFDGVRLCFWGDWENSDRDGRLLANDHLDLLNRCLAAARAHGIGVLFTPITTYSSLWPDGQDSDVVQGFAKHFKKSDLGRDPAAIAAQVRYVRELLEHVNPHTGTALKDEPAILCIELINEPWHHSADRAGSVAYINALADAVRSTGCDVPLFYNVSQDFGIVPALRESRAQGATFGWYPTGLNSGATLRGNFLRTVDDYPPLHDAALQGMPKLVYEFDAADLNEPTMYSAMVRTFRGGGVQFIAMFAYDMLATAPANLGWQTHALNLVATPQKAVSAIIAAEATRRLPRGETYGGYPRNTRFGPFRVSYEEQLAELVTPEVFMHAGDTRSAPATTADGLVALRRIVGFGSSPLVRYVGKGAYFLDRLSDGVWRLEVYPDALKKGDPFARTIAGREPFVRLVARTQPMALRVPGLGAEFHVTPLDAGNPHTTRATGGEFLARPGVYALHVSAALDLAALPATVAGVGLREFVCPVVEQEGESAVVPRPAPMSARSGMAATTVADSPSASTAAVSLLDPSRLERRALAATRLGDAGRRGLFEVRAATDADPALLRLVFPLSRDRWLKDYTVSHTVLEPVGARGAAVDAATMLRVRARGDRKGHALWVTLVEADGTAWTAELPVTAEWQEFDLPLADLAPARAVMLPQGFPGSWAYWLPPAEGRGDAGDRVRVAAIERLQFSFRPVAGGALEGDDPHAAIAEAELRFP